MWLGFSFFNVQTADPIYLFFIYVIFRVGVGVGVDTGIPYPYPYPTFGYRENPNPYPVNSGITRQSRDGFVWVPTGTDFLAMSTYND